MKNKIGMFLETGNVIVYQRPSADVRRRGALLGTTAGVLARAFFTDPFYVYVFPDDKKREQQIAWWMQCLLNYGLKYGEVHVLADGQGAAIWLGPEKPMYSFVKLLAEGLWRFPMYFSWQELLRTVEVTNQWDRWHVQQPCPHYYLMVLGILPDAQGQGQGSRLLQPMLNRADQEKVPCYLETMKSSNIGFYQKKGFYITQESKTKTHLPFWAMRREVGTGSKPARGFNNS